MDSTWDEGYRKCVD